MAKIEIYTKATCPYCDRAKELLKAKGAKYTEIRIDLDPSQLTRMLELSEGRRTVPQIFINDKGIGGFTDLKALDEEGKLDTLLGSKP